jgi:hypothetical protein
LHPNGVYPTLPTNPQGFAGTGGNGYNLEIQFSSSLMSAPIDFILLPGFIDFYEFIPPTPPQGG